MSRGCCLLVLTLAALPGAGCGNAVLEPSRFTQRVTPGEPEAAAVIAADPKAYVLRVADNTRRLQQYTVRLTRIERRGLLKTLQGPERIECWFRREPFSVRMKWLDEDVKYGESTYVAGQEKNQVRFVPRNGLFGLPPILTKVDPQTPVTWGEARYPVTEFGLERMMDQVLRNMAAAGGALTISYRGIVKLPDRTQLCHHLHFDYPVEQFPASQVDFYVDPRTDLPVAVIIRFPDGKLDSAYFYEQLDPHVTLSDADFVMDCERPRGGGS